MADAVLTASLRDEISSGVEAIKGNLGGLGGVAQSAFAFATGGFIQDGISAIASKIGEVGSAVAGFAGEAAQAQRDLQAELGLTEEQTAALGDIANDVFVAGWGGSIGEATAMVGEAKKQLGDLANVDLGQMTQGAAAIADTFGADYPQVINTAKTLMTSFGLSGQEALDFITKGYQQGLNSSGDFLDSIGEYGPQFNELGANAGEFFSAMETGMQGGVLGTDKVADLFKETRLRIGEETDATRGALESIGIDADAFYAGLRDGSLTGIEAFNQIKGALGDVSDPVTQNTAAIAQMGTQWEDMGASAVLGVDTTSTAMADMQGSTDGLGVKYENLGALAQSAWRTSLTEMEPVSAKLMDIANGAMPLVQAGLAWLGEELPPLVDGAVAAIDSFSASASGIMAAIEPAISFIQANAIPIMAGIAGVLLAVVVPAFFAWAGAAATAAAAQIVALAPIIAVVAAVGLAVGLLVAAWQSNFLNIQGITASVWAALQPVFAQIGNILTAVVGAAVSALAAIWTNVLVPAFNTAVSVITTLQPLFAALADVGLAIVQAAAETLGNLFQATLLPAFTAIGDYITNTAVPAFTSAASAAKDTLQPALDGLNGFLGTISSGFGGVSGAIDTLVGWLKKAADVIRSLPSLPEGWMPHSPPPIQVGFEGIAAAVMNLASRAFPQLGKAVKSLPNIGLDTKGMQVYLKQQMDNLKALQAIQKATKDAQGDKDPLTVGLKPGQLAAIQKGYAEAAKAAEALAKAGDQQAALDTYAEMSRFLKERADLMAAINNAQAAGDKNAVKALTAQLTLAEKIHAAAMLQIADETKARLKAAEDVKKANEEAAKAAQIEFLQNYYSAFADLREQFAQSVADIRGLFMTVEDAMQALNLKALEAPDMADYAINPADYDSLVELQAAQAAAAAAYQQELAAYEAARVGQQDQIDAYLADINGIASNVQAEIEQARQLAMSLQTTGRFTAEEANDWFGMQQKYLMQIGELQQQIAAAQIAGDSGLANSLRQQLGYLQQAYTAQQDIFVAEDPYNTPRLGLEENNRFLRVEMRVEVVSNTADPEVLRAWREEAQDLMDERLAEYGRQTSRQAERLSR